MRNSTSKHNFHGNQKTIEMDKAFKIYCEYILKTGVVNEVRGSTFFEHGHYAMEEKILKPHTGPNNYFCT
jgi:hypothetical protein